MYAIATLLVVLATSLLVTRIATVALVSTGLSRESARFQARSAFSGAGFTTSEAEAVVGHPVRRRIIMLLILLGNAGLVTVVSTLILSFLGSEGASDNVQRMLVLAGGLAILWVVASSRYVDRYLSWLIERALRRWTHLDVADYAGLLHLGGDYRVVEMRVEPGDWMAGRALEDLRLNEEGVLVLGIERDGTFLGTPRGRRVIDAGDLLTLYGRSSSLVDLDSRPAGPEGEAAHRRAVGEQGRVEVEEAAVDAATRGDQVSPSG